MGQFSAGSQLFGLNLQNPSTFIWIMKILRYFSINHLSAMLFFNATPVSLRASQICSCICKTADLAGRIIHHHFCSAPHTHTAMLRTFKSVPQASRKSQTTTPASVFVSNVLIFVFFIHDAWEKCYSGWWILKMWHEYLRELLMGSYTRSKWSPCS